MKQSKRGFTLIELIVVLAILAIVAAIAVPTAFGALERVKDRAAVSSLHSMRSMLNMAHSMVFLDDGFQKLTTENTCTGIMYYENGAFTAAGTGPEAGVKYEQYFYDVLAQAGFKTTENAFFHIYMQEHNKAQGGDFWYRVAYAPDGGVGSSANPQPSKPYYVYESATGLVIKFAEDGTQTPIA